MPKLNEIFTVSQTYQCVTPESAESGDFSDSGYEFKNKKYSLRDILHELKNQGRGHIQSGMGRIDIYGWSYTSDYSTAEDTTRCLHINASERLIRRLSNILEKLK